MHSTQFLADNLQKMLKYAEMLAADIPDNKFTHKPHANMNHPAWVYGHLAIYPDRLLPVLGHDAVARTNERFVELFSPGTDCFDDPARYPQKNEILEEFFARHQVLVGLLPEVTDETLARDLPIESYREFFPKIGHAVHFLFSGHLMSHLGQVSAWRRAIGLGSVM